MPSTERIAAASRIASAAAAFANAEAGEPPIGCDANSARGPGSFTGSKTRPSTSRRPNDCARK